MALQQTREGESGVQMALQQTEALELVCGYGTRQKLSFNLGQYRAVLQAGVPLMREWMRIWIGTIVIGLSTFSQTAKLRLKL
jgi:hypothetical protein